MAELKKGIATFEALGIFEANGKTKIDQTNKPTWKYSNMFFKLKCGDENISTSLIGGFNPLAPRDIEYSEFGGKLHPIVEKNGRATIDWRGSCAIKWEKRFEKSELEKVAAIDKIRVEIVKGEREEFLTNYDLINYLAENLQDKQALKIYGNINYEYKDGKLEENYLITQIYGAEISEEYPAFCKFRQTVLIDSNSVQPVENGIIPIQGFTPQYINHNGEDYINSVIAVPFEFNFDTESLPKYQIYLDKFFKVEPKKFSEIVIEYGVKKYGDIKQITLEDIMTDENKDVIETDLLFGMSEEEVLEKYVGSNRRAVASGDVKYLKVFRDIGRTSEKIEEKVVLKHQFAANKYKESEVFFVEDFVGKRRQSQQKLEPKLPKPQSQKEETIEDVDFDELFK